MKPKETTPEGSESPPKKGFVRIKVNMTERVQYKFTRDIAETQLAELQLFANEGDDDTIAEFITELKDPYTDALDALDPEVTDLHYLKDGKWIEI